MSDIVTSKHSPHGFYIWRGLQHEWLRRVAGFRIPHRISKLHSFIDAERHTLDAQNWTPCAFFQFGQSTGVDGNHMKPLGFYQAIHAPGVYRKLSQVQFQFTDKLDELHTTYPIATTTLSQTNVVDLPPALQNQGELCAVAILRGLALDMRCDPQKQPKDRPCNSHGMWPSWFEVSLDSCEQRDGQIHFTTSIVIHRAWTPHLGGVPPIEIKPLNLALDFDFSVMVTILIGDKSTFCATNGPRVQRHHDAQSTQDTTQDAAILGIPKDYKYGVGALSGFGFELTPKHNVKKQNHLGRYIDQLRFSLQKEQYNQTTGALSVQANLGVGVPKTVVDARVRAWLNPVLLQFSDPATQLLPPKQVMGKLCANSQNAPFFSKWQKCHDENMGPEQRQHRQPIDSSTLP